MRLRHMSWLMAMIVGTLLTTGAAAAEKPRALVMLVMDPLALPLSCPCVKGYAQRDYDKLANHLSQELERPVQVYFCDSLPKAFAEKTSGIADIVIGKRSVVEIEAADSHLNLSAILSLTGKDGLTTQTGLIVVRSTDPAKTTADLKNYRIIFGPSSCAEKHGAAIALLKKHGITPLPAPATAGVTEKNLETCSACSDGAEKILELGAEVRAATVISSYAAPLLEGCGTVKKGALRVVGTTDPVPFVTAFVSTHLPEPERANIRRVLLGVSEEPALLLAIESKSGFVPLEQPAAAPKPASGKSAAAVPAEGKPVASNPAPGKKKAH